MTEIRCKKCNRLLMKGWILWVNIKCPKCKYENSVVASRVDLIDTFTRENMDRFMNLSLAKNEGIYMKESPSRPGAIKRAENEKFWRTFDSLSR